MLEGASILVSGLGFPESPRWHDNKLWFSDFHTKKVMSVRNGSIESVIEVPGQPSGLGWTPENRLLVVSMLDRRLMCLEQEELVEVANLWTLASSHCNDMVVSAEGWAYIGNYGYDTDDPTAELRLAEIIAVKQDGIAQVVAKDMAFPNGSVITPDGSTLIVAETLAARLTAFTIGKDGTLFQRRIWAQFDDLGIGMEQDDYINRVMPDGICMDAEGGMWVASPGMRGISKPGVLRVQEGGEVTHRIEGTMIPLACILGSSDGCTLFTVGIATDENHNPLPEPNGCIVTLRVGIPHAGLP